MHHQIDAALDVKIKSTPTEQKQHPLKSLANSVFCPLYIVMLSFGPKPTRVNLFSTDLRDLVLFCHGYWYVWFY